MMLRSFRIRVALSSAILAGSALIGFGGLSWWLIYDAKVNRLDAELESQLFQAGRASFDDRWQVYEAGLAQALSTGVRTPIVLQVTDPNGNLIYQSSDPSADLKLTIDRSRFPAPQPPPIPPVGAGRLPPPLGQGRPPNMPPPSAPQFFTQSASTGDWRVGAIEFPRAQVAIAVSLAAIQQEMATTRNAFLISIVALLTLVAGAAWGLAGNALRPIQQLTTAIQQLTVQGLDRRVPTSATDIEFAELIQVFNQMLERLERSFKQASRFSGDAAHELKTPLAILQGELERSLQQAEPGSELQQTLSHLLDEVRRLSSILRKLLLLSLADAGQMRLQQATVDVSQLLTDLTEDIELLAPQLDLQTTIAPGLQVQGDRDLLIQVLQNLISNAIKYNLPDGWITIQAQQQRQNVRVTISNRSRGIPVKEQSRIFDRFYRGDPARTRKVEGTGLGLSLSREIARAHGGALTLEPSEPDCTVFSLSLPSLQR